ncbi:hypothetical protein [Microbacterium album]|uniref:Uncharacterized protein n=1 Tax=Microbacterium album TaxID=2053191 RepID=A0A917ICK0_9MICO|nr:hypothetical protein [Microbacterium album]GGH34522.1 hypothetical protein GCM10010921_02290 [Microbacterium album]
MRLSELLSKAPSVISAQVEGFLDDRPLAWGKHKKIKVGKIFHNFHCRGCGDVRTFESGEELYCLGLGAEQISIDATLRCMVCKASVEAWFLVSADENISGRAPEVRVDRYAENLRDRADRIGAVDGPFADLVKRAQLAYECGLGAGAVIYLRKIFEKITWEVADLVGVETKKPNGNPRPFAAVLKEVNDQRMIIPQRFSSDGYHLFSELSGIIHGDSSETEALEKFKPCLQLVLGVVEEVSRDNKVAKAIEDLGWNVDVINAIAEKEDAA